MVVKKIADGLKKTRNQLSSVFKSIFSGNVITDDIYEEIEESLVQADIGVDTVCRLVKNIEDQLSRKDRKDLNAVFLSLKNELNKYLHRDDNKLKIAPSGMPTVILVVGVNGTGKTTSVARLANHFLSGKKRVILAACDTFRGAAIEQLEIWANRTGTQIVKHQHGADAAAVAYDAAQAACARKADYLIIDTAGRLHTNKNLMAELKKIKRSVSKLIPDAPHEVLITIDAVTGQNAIPQVKLFHQELNLTGLILTKLDGTAKGGVVIQIQNELGVPVKFIGVGEGMDDLLPFKSDDFIDALFEA